MNRYIGVVVAASGCDYSIACGTKVIDIEASNIAEASDILDQYYLDNIDCGIESAIVYGVIQSIASDLEGLRRKYEKQKAADQKDEEEKWQTYLELKAHFEKKERNQLF